MRWNWRINWEGLRTAYSDLIPQFGRPVAGVASCADVLRACLFLPHGHLLNRASTSVRRRLANHSSFPISGKWDFHPALYSRGNMADVSSALERLCEQFRISEFNALQKEAITHFVLKKTDLFVNLPTGFGKSLIYQAFPWKSDACWEGSIFSCLQKSWSTVKNWTQAKSAIE